MPTARCKPSSRPPALAGGERGGQITSRTSRSYGNVATFARYWRGLTPAIGNCARPCACRSRTLLFLPHRVWSAALPGVTATVRRVIVRHHGMRPTTLSGVTAAVRRVIVRHQCVRSAALSGVTTTVWWIIHRLQSYRRLGLFLDLRLYFRLGLRLGRFRLLLDL